MPTPDIDTVLAAAREHLLAWRTPAGHWEGHLASSALATATAAWALHVAERDRGPGPFSRLIQPALDWLADHQNRDGGWGDTVLSRSNLSTTVLGWSALAATDGRDAHAGAARRAEAYVADAAGGLEPATIADAVIASYGEDRTFSAPILMTAAMAGRLGPEAEAWRRVPALPFELAALPPAWWKRLRMQVVSYALPALIAIGQARHRRAPPRCPLRRLVRRAAVRPTLARLAAIQPASGGFLEAVPLTSFVTMALAAAGQADHPVLGRCVSFLARSVRDNGAWPIDTNLATWVTTLAIQALAAGENLDAAMPTDHRRRLADWLIRQQHTEVHPYTRAAPGGWAWTDLAGGVPDADDTAGALAALAHLAPDNPAERRGGSEPVPIAAEGYPPRREGERAAGAETRRAPSSVTTAAAGVRWLLGLQNADGGVPTFCRGWGRLPFDRSSPDLTAHALAAWSAWRDRLPPALREATDAAARRALAYLARTQRPDGAWVPLWFGNEHVADETNPTYGTARVVAALARVAQAGDWTDAAARPAAMAARGVGWLLSAQQPAGGWGGDENAPPSVEETALATEALARWSHTAEAADAARRGAAYLAEATRGGTAFEPAPIGFYFARLWYFERLYPVIFTVGALEAASGAVATR